MNDILPQKFKPYHSTLDPLEAIRDEHRLPLRKLVTFLFYNKILDVIKIAKIVEKDKSLVSRKYIIRQEEK